MQHASVAAHALPYRTARAARPWSCCCLPVPSPCFHASLNRSDFGRLGTGDCKDVFVPCPLPSLAGRTVASVACGDTHTLVATDDGQLFSFGRNQSGQLGLGSIQDSLLPQPVLALQVGSGHSWLG